MNSRFAGHGVMALLAFLAVHAKASDATTQAPGGTAQGFSAPSTAPNAAAPAADTKANSYDQLGVVNNLYALDQAAKKFFLLHKAVNVTYAELVGPDKLVKEVRSVDGEDYTQLVFEKGQRIDIHMPDGRIIHYPLGSGPISSLAIAAPAAPAAKAQAAPIAKAPAAPAAKASAEVRGASILDNLHALSQAAEKYYKDNDATSTTYWQLVGPGKYIPTIKPAEGEDYRSLLFKKGHSLRLYMKDGRVIAYPPPPPAQKAP